jgi:molybdenum cofactor guanylyltransferase
MVKSINPIEGIKDRAEVVILCGGEGKRLGGVEKASIRFCGERLIDRLSVMSLKLASKLSWVERVPYQISDPKNYAHFRVIDDPVGGGVGALIAALKSAKKEWVWVLACDLPLIKLDHLVALAETAIKAKPEIACVIYEDDHQAHPLCGIWRASHVAQLEKYISSRGRLTEFAFKYGSVIPISDSITVDKLNLKVSPLLNINHVEDLKLLRTLEVYLL